MTGNGGNDLMEVSRCNNNTTLSATKSPCAIEGCLSSGLGGLFPTRSCLQLKPERRVSFAQNYKPSTSEKLLHRLI